MEKLYDSDGREYTPSQPAPEVQKEEVKEEVSGLNEPVAAESTGPASEPAQ